MNGMMQAAGLAREPARALEGRVALVTGSTSGIGLGIAQALAARGAMIVLNGFGDPEAIGQLCRELGARHEVSVTYDGADLMDAEAIHAMVERSGRAMGPVDILVNNAGIQHVAPIETFPPEKWNAILALNLTRRVPRHPGGAAGDEAARLGTDRQYCLGARPGRLAVQGRLCRRQARRGRLHQGDGAGGGRGGHHLQCGLPRLCVDTARREAGRGAGGGAWHLRKSR